MFSKYFKMQFYTLIFGVISIIVSAVIKSALPQSKIFLILTISAVLFFIITMIYYYKIISVLSEVTNISKVQIWIAMISHIATLVALCLWNYMMIALPIFFVASVILRKVFGIREIDEQMELLCKELDFKLYIIGKEQENETET
ncbi:MAG: hypothetical protein ACRC7V_05630 [Lachnospiraceae bacterium]